MVRLLAERAGAEVIDHGVIGDDFVHSRRGRDRPASDVLVVSGGVSVGPHDHVKPAFEACGIEEIFWRVRVKPGKPLWFGRRGSTLVFGSPATRSRASSASSPSSSPPCVACTASATPPCAP